MTDFLLILAGFAAGCLWGAVKLGGGVVSNLKRMLPLGGGGPDPVDPRQ